MPNLRIGESSMAKIGDFMTVGEAAEYLCVSKDSLRRGVGLGYVVRQHAKAGTALQLDIRGRVAGATVVKPPFVKETSLMA